MDDVFGILPSWMFTAIVAVIVLLIIGIIFARLYRRASAEQAFVRTGLGGQKVVMSGGAIVMPIFHEIIPINMNTLKLSAGSVGLRHLQQLGQQIQSPDLPAWEDNVAEWIEEMKQEWQHDVAVLKAWVANAEKK